MVNSDLLPNVDRIAVFRDIEELMALRRQDWAAIKRLPSYLTLGAPQAFNPDMPNKTNTISDNFVRFVLWLRCHLGRKLVSNVFSTSPGHPVGHRRDTVAHSITSTAGYYDGTRIRHQDAATSP